MHPLNLNQVLREAFFASMLALLLTLPMAGLKLEEAPDGLILLTRFDSVILIVVTVFIAKVLWSYLAHYIAQRQTNRSANRITKYIQENSLGVGIAAIVLTIALPWLPFSDRYIIDLATTILIYIMLGWGLNIVVGLAGLLDLGYVAFYAIGAYSYALLAEYGHLTFWQALPLAGVFSALFALLIGFPVLRLRGDYLAIVTLGFAEVVRIILLNWQSFTHGPNGITGIPRPSFFGLPFGREGGGTEPTFHEYFHLEYITEHRLIFLYYLILLLVLFTNWLVLRLRRLPLGRAWEALREDETACRSLGINPTTVKLSAVAIGAMLAGLAGAFFATRQGFISPESFTFNETALILAIVVLAGMGSQLGVVFGAIILVALPEIGREFADFRMLFFGLIMVLIMLWRPRGLFAKRMPTILWRKGGAA